MTLKPLALSLTTCLLILTNNSQANVSESHVSDNIDPNAPITVLDKLQSLQNPSELEFTLPKIEHFSSKNGTPVIFVQTNNLPMVDIDIRFNAGSARDESIKPNGFGLASLVASMLSKGTTNKSEDLLAEEIEQLGIDLDISAYKDMFVISLRSLSDDKYLNPALQLVEEILTQPTFPNDSLERTKARYLVALKQAQEDPNTIANQTFIKELYANHPYAHPSMGTPESIPNIHQQDLQNFTKRYLVAQNAYITITGDISRQQAENIANQLTQTLPTGSPAPALPDAKPLTTSKTIHLPFDSTQTTVIMGQLGEKRSRDPQILQQHTNFNIADEVVGGGGFQARLMTEIRQKRGLTYGIYSGMTPMQSQGNYSISFSTQNENSQQAIDATLQVIQDVIDNGISENELTLTKENLMNRFPTLLSSNASINGQLSAMNFYQLPDSYLSEYNQRIQQATLDEVNQSYRQLVQPNKFLIVTVGKTQTTKQPTATVKKEAKKAQKKTKIDK